MKTKQTQGRLNRQSGSIWERKVRDDLIKKGWNVSKFQSNVNLILNLTIKKGTSIKIIKDILDGFYKGFKSNEKGFPQIEPRFKSISINMEEGEETRLNISGKFVPAQTSNKFRRGTLGFPDFICWKKPQGDDDNTKWDMARGRTILQELIAVEAKSNGYLDKIEKAKCRWLIENKIFSKILIAKKKKEGRKVIPEYFEFEVLK